MILSLIVAAAENDVIGRNNALPWKQSADLQYFRDTTKGHPIVMGRKTYESIGRPLPNRRNIILSRSDQTIEGCELIHSLDELQGMFEEESEVFIIGGANVYAQALGMANRIYLTRIHATIDGDTVLPTINWDEWKKISGSEMHPADVKNQHPYTFEVYERRK